MLCTYQTLLNTLNIALRTHLCFSFTEGATEVTIQIYLTSIDTISETNMVSTLKVSNKSSAGTNERSDY